MRGASGEPMDPLDTLEIERCSDLMGSPTREEMERGLDGFLAHVHPRKVHGQPRWRRWSLVAGAAALSVLSLLVASSFLRRHLHVPEAALLAYRVEGGSEMESGYLGESGHDGIQVLFSEGSRFDLVPGARGRIRTVDKDGA